MLNNIAIPLARDNLPGVVNNLASNAINEFESKIIGNEERKKWMILMKSKNY